MAQTAAKVTAAATKRITAAVFIERADLCRTATARRHTRIGHNTTPENFVTQASAVKSATPSMLMKPGARHVRHKKYTAPKMKQVMPRSVVMSDAWAARFGSSV